MESEILQTMQNTYVCFTYHNYYKTLPKFFIFFQNFTQKYQIRTLKKQFLRNHKILHKIFT